jgi:HEAT repeat protein
MDFDHASRVVEALAPQGEKYVERILDLLGKKVEDFDTDPMVWMEVFLVELAGEMRLEPAIPLIVKKLHEDGDYLLEECIEALGKIGTDAAAEAVTEGWLEAKWDYRLYATTALEYIHSDTTVRKCLELLPQDKDLNIRTKLADALLSQFADEGIEPVREIVQREDYDPMDSDLMRKLVAVSTVMGVNYPEYPIWKQEASERLAEQERKMKEMDGFIQSPPPPALPESAPRKRQGDSYEPKLTPILRTEEQVGRNDPCPCGSGKKFKKCCINKNKS